MVCHVKASPYPPSGCPTYARTLTQRVHRTRTMHKRRRPSCGPGREPHELRAPALHSTPPAWLASSTWWLSCAALVEKPAQGRRGAQLPFSSLPNKAGPVSAKPSPWTPSTGAPLPCWASNALSPVELWLPNSFSFFRNPFHLQIFAKYSS
jgi:hypothetical protein